MACAKNINHIHQKFLLMRDIEIRKEMNTFFMHVFLFFFLIIRNSNLFEHFCQASILFQVMQPMNLFPGVFFFIGEFSTVVVNTGIERIQKLS